MKAIERHINEIKRYQEAIEKTDSNYLKNDYSKKISRMIKELREYCYYRDYDFTDVLRRLNDTTQMDRRRT